MRGSSEEVGIDHTKHGESVRRTKPIGCSERHARDTEGKQGQREVEERRGTEEVEQRSEEIERYRDSLMNIEIDTACTSEASQKP